MNIKFNDFTAAYLMHQNKFDQAYSRVMKAGWYILGTEVAQFEQELTKYLGIKYAIGVANGLEALQISLMALNIKKGDEIITTPLSAVATTLAILAVGAKPIFIDTNEVGQIDANLIEAKITKKTKAILPVHLYGQSCNLIKIQQLCRQYKLFLIEDAAQAIGSSFKNKKLGSFGQLNCFSFYPTKNLGAIGDAGAIVTNSKKLANKCLMIRNYGQKAKYVHTVYGLNSRLDELQAAFLKIKLKSLDQENQLRNTRAHLYHKLLKSVAEIEVISSIPNSQANYHLLVIKAKKRDKLQAYLAQKGIETLIHYPLLIPDQPILKAKFGQAKIPTARKLVKQILSLPCHPQLTPTQVKFVVSQIKNFYQS